MSNAKFLRNDLQALSYFRLFGAVNIAQIVSSAAIWIKDELRRQRSEEAVAEFIQLSESEISEEEDDLVNYFLYCGDILFEEQVNMLCKLIIST